MGAATHLSFSVQPSSSFDSEVTLPQQPVIQALDAGSAVDTTFTGLITLTSANADLVKRTGAAPATLNCVAGVATFTDLNVSAGQACTLVASASGLTSATSSTMTPTAVNGRDGEAERPRFTPDTTYPSPISATFTVGSGKTYPTIQQAITAAVAANTGSAHAEILIDNGTTWTESLSFPKATGTGWIVIRPVTMPCAAGTRAQPSMFTGGVKLKAPTNQLNIGCVNGAHHFRLAGLEIEGNWGTFLQFAEAGGATLTSNCPDFLGLDRCYLHGTSALNSTRAIEYGAKSLFLVDMYGAEVHAVGNGDTQIISGWSGPGPLLIKNSYLEAAGEITMMGGSDTALVDVVTSDITIDGNHFRKPPGWQRPGTPPHAAAGTWDSKNLTELKSGRRVWYKNNLFENQWYDAQNTAITFGSAGQYGTSPWMGIRDLIFEKNVVRNASRFIVVNRMNQSTIGPIKRSIATATTGGSIPTATTYWYKITALFNSSGFSGTESSDQMDGDSGSNEQTITTGAGSTNKNTIVFRQTPGAIGFRVYRGTSSGGENQYVQFSPPGVDGADVSWVDTGALSWTGGTVPAGTPVKTLCVPMHRVSVHDNLAVVNNTTPFNDQNHSENCFVQGVAGLQFTHNTIVADAETGCYLGAPASPRGRFDYNIVTLRHYGAGGDVGGLNVAAMFVNEFPTSVTRNVGLDTDTNFAPDISTYGGTWGGGPAATVGFTDYTKLTGGTVRSQTFAQLIAAATLTPGAGGSAYNAAHSWTGDGKDAGADMTALATAISGVWVPGEGTALDGTEPGAGVGAADHLAMSVQPAGAVSGVALTTQPVVLVKDSGGSTVTGDTSTVTASWVSLTGDAAGSGTLTKAASAGVATFTNLVLTWTVPSTGYWHFTDGSLTSVNSNTLSLTVVTPPPPDDSNPFGIVPGAPAVYRMARGKAVFGGFRRTLRQLWRWLTLSSSLA